MALNPRSALRQLVWRFINPDRRSSLKSAYATVAGRLMRRRPHVEIFSRNSGGNMHGQLQTQVRETDVNSRTPLCRIMTSYGSDKGIGRHNYTRLYYNLLAPLRDSNLRLFELGIGTNNPNLVSTMGERGKPGASLRGWAEFFPRGEIMGADIDRDILFREGRIKTFYCDQLSKDAIDMMWAQPELSGEFDVLIEDGLHTFEANIFFLENSLHKVRRGGYYIVEDVRQADLPRWRERLAYYSAAHSDFSFLLVRLPWMFNDSDNNLLVAKRNSK